MFLKPDLMCKSKEGRAESLNKRFNSMDFFSGFVLPVLVSNWYQNSCNLQRLFFFRIKTPRLDESCKKTQQMRLRLCMSHVETPYVSFLLSDLSLVFLFCCCVILYHPVVCFSLVVFCFIKSTW